MMSADRRASVGEASTELEQAARIPGRHDFRPGGGDPVELPDEQLARDLGLHQVVHPGRAAAEIGLGELDQTKSRDRAQESPRRLPHALPVCKVTGLMVRHA